MEKKQIRLLKAIGIVLIIGALIFGICYAMVNWPKWTILGMVLVVLVGYIYDHID